MGGCVWERINSECSILFTLFYESLGRRDVMEKKFSGDQDFAYKRGLIEVGNGKQKLIFLASSKLSALGAINMFLLAVYTVYEFYAQNADVKIVFLGFFRRSGGLRRAKN